MLRKFLAHHRGKQRQYKASDWNIGLLHVQELMEILRCRKGMADRTLQLEQLAEKVQVFTIWSADAMLRTGRGNQSTVEIHLSGRWLSGSAWPFWQTFSDCNCTACFYGWKFFPQMSNTNKESNVYWTVHHCNSWRMKDQLDVTCYFISLIMRSTCFGH